MRNQQPSSPHQMTIMTTTS